MSETSSSYFGGTVGGGGGGAERPPQVRSAVQTVTFNETFAAKDPAEFLGRWLGDFAVNFVVPLPRPAMAGAEALRAAVYAETEQRLFAKHIGSVEHAVLDYSDDKVHEEPARRYIKVRLHTARDNEVTTLFRCFVHGAHLYVAADSYRLGRVSIVAVAARVLVSLYALILAAQLTDDLFLLSWPLFLGLMWFFWGDVARAARHGGLSNGLRSRYPRPIVNSSFDLDDSLMFLKSLLPMILQVLKDVGPSHGLDLRSMEDLLSDLGRKVATQTINVNNSGTMTGVSVGGIRNTVSANR